MTRAIPEWIGKNDDAKIPDRVKQRINYYFGGNCATCTRPAIPAEYDHIIPLILGGEHRESNLQLLCKSPCHAAKTKLDVKLKAKVARIRKRHVGIKKPRTIRSWRKFNGEIVHASRERT